VLGDVDESTAEATGGRSPTHERNQCPSAWKSMCAFLTCRQVFPFSLWILLFIDWHLLASH
jgi:hypothetical protein